MTSEVAVVKGDTAKRVMADKRHYRITIFGRWCKGCGICSAFCPTHAIQADGDGRPRVAQAAKCSGCQLCALRCPDMAVTVTMQGLE